MSWQDDIAVLVLVQQDLARVDDLFTYHLPELAAGDTELSAAERALGDPLPASYRAFLAAANGWRSVLQNRDLWDAGSIVDPSAHRGVRAGTAAALETGMCAEASAEPDSWLLIGGSTESPDAFLLALRGPHEGEVRWLAGSEVDAFPDFREFFLTLVDYNRLALRSATERRSAP